MKYPQNEINCFDEAEPTFAGLLIEWTAKGAAFAGVIAGVVWLMG